MTPSATLALSAIATLSLVAPAFADDLFTLVGNGGSVITFTEAASPTIPPANVDPNHFYFQGVGGDRFNLPYTLNGTPQLTDEIDFFATSFGGGLAIDGMGGQNFIQQAGPVLFSGTTAMPTFLLGTFNLTSGYPACDGTSYQGTCVDNAEDYRLTISEQSSTTVTPEPASLALLGTGLLTGVTTLRRRLTRA